MQILYDKWSHLNDSYPYSQISSSEQADLANTIAQWLNRLLGITCGFVRASQNIYNGTVSYQLEYVPMPAILECLCPNVECMCAIRDFINSSRVFTIAYLDQRNNAAFDPSKDLILINPQVEVDAKVHIRDTVSGPIFGWEKEDAAVTFWHEAIGHGWKGLDHSSDALNHESAWMAEMQRRIREINNMLNIIGLNNYLSPMDVIGLYPKFKDVFFDDTLENDNIARKCLSRNGRTAMPIAPFYIINRNTPLNTTNP